MPFGNQSFEYGKINYLSPEQALADYAELLTYLKETLPGAKNCPVFAYAAQVHHTSILVQLRILVDIPASEVATEACLRPGLGLNTPTL